MGLAQIKEIDGVLCVKCDGHCWRRVNGTWQMRSYEGNWFDCEIQDWQVKRQVEDFEYCLRPYNFDEGPDYPRKNKKGKVGEFFRNLQIMELRAGAKNIFAPVREKYDAHAANMAEYNRNLVQKGKWERLNSIDWSNIYSRTMSGKRVPHSLNLSVANARYRY